MPILISGRIDFAPAARDAALSGARDLIAMALAEAGCLHYAWTADPHDPGRAHVFEEWESAADLAAHLVGPAYRGMLAHLGACGILASETHKYRCDLKEPVYRADGVPSAYFETKEQASND